MESFTQFITWLDYLTILVSAGTLIFTILNWTSNRKLNARLDQNIEIRLCHRETAQNMTLPHTIKRRHLTRSEIQGILANCYRGGQRYDIPYLGSKAYSDDITIAQNGEKDYVTIPIEDIAEFRKFSG